VNVEELIVPALRHEAVPWPTDATEALETALLDAAGDHGVAALLAAAPAVECWPNRVRAALGRVRRLEAAAEVIRKQDLVRMLDHLGGAGIRGLLLKGAQIAYTHYPHPWLRPRLDTDLLVAPRDRSRADEVLRGLGYAPGTHFDGTLVTHQFQYHRTNRYGLTDVVDLHWKVANPQIFAEAFTFEELDADAIPLSALHANARGPSDAHALVLACVHRVAHHDNSDRLIWLYDIHLLADAMNAACREKVAGVADAKRLRSVCAHGVAHARARFATTAPRDWLDRLEAIREDREPTAAFLQNGRTKMDILISDLRTLPAWRPKVRLIREHLFPPVAYMRRAYGSVNPILLPFTYVHRIATGVGKWFRRQR
jgi:putative nucleotidyltransferase-like protein